MLVGLRPFDRSCPAKRDEVEVESRLPVEVARVGRRVNQPIKKYSEV